MTQAGRIVLFNLVMGFLVGLIVFYFAGLFIGIIAGVFYCAGSIVMFALMIAATRGDEKQDAFLKEPKE